MTGQEFEERMMCKSAFDNVDQVKWALKNLFVSDTQTDTVSFYGKVEGSPAEIMLVMNHETRTPTFLIVGSETVADCERSAS